MITRNLYDDFHVLLYTIALAKRERSDRDIDVRAPRSPTTGPRKLHGYAARRKPHAHGAYARAPECQPIMENDTVSSVLLLGETLYYE